MWLIIRAVPKPLPLKSDLGPLTLPLWRFVFGLQDHDATGVSASMTIAFFNNLAVASVGFAPTPIHFLMAGAFRLVSLLKGLYHPSLCTTRTMFANCLTQQLRSGAVGK